ncbi:MAG: hypothetical protein RBU37_21695 [Myxococcota bacterium]|jgi:acetolactate synthase small subunit|nr:hypothetical protein [Myxococcota bacterium]
MPKLARLRFVSIGHPNARMQDVTLDFCDQDGCPTDSTLWLRNGGGKSSILNLFFALLRTGKRDFLGGKADSKRRSLDDYVLPNDRSVVAAEWQLEKPGELLPERLLIGVFYERSHGREGLRRLFFSTKISDRLPQSTLAGLPLHSIDEDGLEMRRTLAAFKQAWTELRDKAPQLEPLCTETQSEWRGLLERSGLDPDLYAYQLRMNMREGGADELFRFNSHEQFIDFLIELTVDPTHGESIAENLETFRKQLQRRKHELLPDLQLSTGLLERLQPLVQLSEQRGAMQRSVIQASRLLGELDKTARHRITRFEHELEQQRKQSRALRDESTVLELQSQNGRRRAIALRHAAMQGKLREAADAIEEARDHEQAARSEALLWRAAAPMREAQLNEAEAAAYRKQMDERQVERAPMLEELRQTARRYGRAMRHQVLNLRERQTGLKAEWARLEAKARELEQEAARKERELATMIANNRGTQEAIARAEAQRARLAQLGLLRPDQSATEALEEQQGELLRLNRELSKLGSEREQAIERVDEMQRQLREDHRQLAALEAQTQQLELQFKAARGERAQLESDPALLRVLEVEHSDLDQLPDDVTQLIQRRLVEHQDLLVRLRAQRAELERARHHLQERGLLPPSASVERVLDCLRGRVPAVSGWQHIAESLPPGGDARLDAVLSTPELAQGVVVAPKDFERAVELLGHEKLEVDEPVLLSTPDAFNQGPRPDAKRFVLPPRSRAAFDRNAGRSELAALEDRCEQLDASTRATQHAHAEISDVLGRLRFFRSRYPRAWFAENAATLSSARAQLEDRGARLEANEDEAQRLASRRRVIESELEACRQQRSRCEAAAHKLADFVEQVEAQLSLWREQLRQAAELESGVRQEAEALRQQAESARAEAHRQSAAAEPLIEEAMRLESTLEQLRYADSEDKHAEPGPVDELRLSYERQRELYEGEVAGDELHRLAEHHEERARRAWQEVSRTLREGPSRDEVAKALAGLANPNELDRERERAEEQLLLAQTRVFERDYERKLLRKQAEDVEKAWHTLGKPSLADAPKDAESALQEAVEAEDQATKLALQAQSLLLQASELERACADAQHQAANLGKDLERLNSVRRSHAQLLPSVEGELSVLEDDVDIALSIEQCEEELGRVRAAMELLDERAKQAVAALRKLLSDVRADESRSEVAARFRTLDNDALEAGAAEFCAALELRIRELKSTIEDVERHRSLLNKLVLSLAEEGLRQLKLADRASHVPLEVPEIGGAQFLRISTHEPLAPDARLDLIAQLVDELIDEEQFPSGVALVQRAVRQLARPFRIRVLNPDPAAPQRYIPITDTARFSGGEQLTCAILLYCTLANVRARSRGQHRQLSSVLLLDNPIGRASRTRFLEMQREFARAMQIQLIYTTAVNDHEALHILPNVVRLRNERVDRHRGHRLIEHLSEGDEQAIRRIEAVRLGRREEGYPPLLAAEESQLDWSPLSSLPPSELDLAEEALRRERD